jgi:hypothetical protein
MTMNAMSMRIIEVSLVVAGWPGPHLNYGPKGAAASTKLVAGGSFQMGTYSDEPLHSF